MFSAERQKEPLVFYEPEGGPDIPEGWIENGNRAADALQFSEEGSGIIHVLHGMGAENGIKLLV